MSLLNQWVGSSCGLHGPYIFYKAFKFHRGGKPRILALGDFFFVRCRAEEPVCIAELQLLWEERTSRQLLSSSKLYFLPEDTPQGRAAAQHGEVGPASTSLSFCFFFFIADLCTQCRNLSTFFYCLRACAGCAHSLCGSLCSKTPELCHLSCFCVFFSLCLSSGS